MRDEYGKTGPASGVDAGAVAVNETPRPQSTREGLLELAAKLREEANRTAAELEAQANDPDLDDLDVRYEHHPPTAEQTQKYREIRRGVGRLAADVVRLCPPSRERSRALSALDDVMFNANASIARRTPGAAQAERDTAPEPVPPPPDGVLGLGRP